jgi:hypothetical protein
MNAPRVARTLKAKERETGSGVYRSVKKLSYDREGHYPTSILPFKRDGAGKGGIQLRSQWHYLNTSIVLCPRLNTLRYSNS